MNKLTLTPSITLSFPCRSRADSAGWYERHLGFGKLFDAEDIGWTEIATNVEGVTIGFGENIEPRPGNCVPVFGVADLDAARAAMEADGVRFDGETIVHEGMVKLATFYDPDENALMLAQNLMQG